MTNQPLAQNDFCNHSLPSGRRIDFEIIHIEQTYDSMLLGLPDTSIPIAKIMSPYIKKIAYRTEPVVCDFTYVNYTHSGPTYQRYPHLMIYCKCNSDPSTERGNFDILDAIILVETLPKNLIEHILEKIDSIDWKANAVPGHF